MKWVIWIVVSLIAVGGVVGLIGYFLPVGHTASRSAEFNKPPESVFALFSNLENYLSWWDGATVKSELVESVPPSKLVTRVVGETQFGGTWTIEIVAAGTGSRVTITERGEVYNPIFRTLSRFVFGHTATMESCLKAAQQRLAGSAGL
jgi:uncharacterized protein YndB with AHSA1/START domain